MNPICDHQPSLKTYFSLEKSDQYMASTLREEDGCVLSTVRHRLTTVGDLGEDDLNEVLALVKKKLRKNTNLDREITLRWSQTSSWEPGSGTAYWTTPEEKKILRKLLDGSLQKSQWGNA